MPRAPFVISGLVRDARDKPISGARVYFTTGPVPLPEIAALTDANGEFILSVPVRGTYGLEVNAEGFARQSAQVTTESARTRVAVTLKRET